MYTRSVWPPLIVILGRDKLKLIRNLTLRIVINKHTLRMRGSVVRVRLSFQEVTGSNPGKPTVLNSLETALEKQHISKLTPVREFVLIMLQKKYCVLLIIMITSVVWKYFPSYPKLLSKVV